MFLYTIGQPHFDYKLLRSVEFTCLAGRLQGIQDRCTRTIRNCRDESGESEVALQALGWISLAEQRAKNKVKVMFEIFHDLAPGRPSKILIEAHATNSKYNLKIQLKRLPFLYPKDIYLKKCLS